MHRTATIQTRGRVTLPVQIREALQIAPGDHVVFVETAAGRFEVKAEAQTAALLGGRLATRAKPPRSRASEAVAVAFAGGE